MAQREPQYCRTDDYPGRAHLNSARQLKIDSSDLTIQGQGHGSLISMQRFGQDALQINTYGVRIRNLRITRILGSSGEEDYNASGSGIVLQNGSTRWIDGVEIHGFNAAITINNEDTESIENSDLRRNGRGIVLNGPATHATTILKLRDPVKLGIWHFHPTAAEYFQAERSGCCQDTRQRN